MVALMQNQFQAIALPNIQQLKKEGFIGRSQILNKIDHWLQQNNQRFFILNREPGAGKSTTLLISFKLVTILLPITCVKQQNWKP